ncbi:MAG: choice-of-anchor B family protein [Phycisphaerales bacterium]
MKPSSVFASRRSLLGLVLAAGTAAPSAALHPEDAALMAKGDPGNSGMLGVFPASNIEFLSQVPLSQIDPGSATGNDIWGYVSPAGREIAIIGVESATSFVDVTVPTQPVILATFPSPTSLWRDIKVLGDFAYVVSEGGGHIQVFDMSQVDSGTVISRGNANFGGSSASHNIVVNPDSGYLYRVGGGSDLGLRAYSVGLNGQPGTPTSPSQSLVQSNLYVHDAQVVTYDSGPYAGREIAFLCSGFGNGGTDTALRIYDVTNKSNIVQLGIVRYPGRQYSHQGWLSEDRRYFYLNDELDEGVTTATTRLHIINVENLNNPFYVRGWTNNNTARDHNLYVKGDYIYAANYRSGLRIHDISDPENPVEVAWIDTFPSDDGQGFDGAWSSYPYFPSGTVVISDIQQGLVVVRPGIDNLVFDFTQPLPETTSPTGGETVQVQITQNGVTLDPSSVELIIDTDDGQQFVLAGSVAGSVASFTTPPFDCLDELTYRARANATDGRSFTSAPATSIVATGTIVAFADNAESDPGWTVSGNASDGQWTRGIPVNAGRGDPATDADGSGRAWLTDNSSANGGNSDVDNGQTVLTSPIIDASAGGRFSYSYWLNDIAGGELGVEDFFRVQYSINGGTSWTTLRTFTDALGAWRQDSFEIGVDAPSSPTFAIRFIASETTPGDVMEAGVDALRLVSFVCEVADCPADVNGNGIADPGDFTAWVTAYNANDPAADQNGDGAVDPSDFTAWVSNYNAGC